MCRSGAVTCHTTVAAEVTFPVRGKGKGPPQFRKGAQKKEPRGKGVAQGGKDWRKVRISRRLLDMWVSTSTVNVL